MASAGSDLDSCLKWVVTDREVELMLGICTANLPSPEPPSSTLSTWRRVTSSARITNKDL